MIARTYDDRFWRRVAKVDDGCWLWSGGMTPGGYGVAARRDGSGQTVAHRIAYEILVGEIPAGLVLDHLCRVRNCVRPDHLEPVTQGENARRGNGAKVDCKYGHPLSGANLYRNPKGYRACRTCRRAARREWEQRNRDYARDYRRAYWSERPERKNAISRASYARMTAEQLASRRARERARGYTPQQLERRRELARARRAEWSPAKREQVRAYLAEWNRRRKVAA